MATVEDFVIKLLLRNWFRAGVMDIILSLKFYFSFVVKPWRIPDFAGQIFIIAINFLRGFILPFNQ